MATDELLADPGRLAAELEGDPGAPGLTIVHGFAQDRRCLGPLGSAFVDRWRVLRPDAPGHGGSWRHAAADLEHGADLLASTMPPGVLLGYSMGGRLSLVTTLERPEVVRALVLIGATAGIEDEGQRAARRRRDEDLADRLERVGIDVFVEQWLAAPLFAGLPDWARFDEQRRGNRAGALAASLRHAGTGAMRPRWRQLHELDVPVLCITGANDVAYGEVAARLVDTIGPTARHEVVAGAGHAAHLEQPDATIEVVGDFLDGLGVPDDPGGGSPALRR